MKNLIKIKNTHKYEQVETLKIKIQEVRNECKSKASNDIHEPCQDVNTSLRGHATPGLPEKYRRVHNGDAAAARLNGRAQQESNPRERARRTKDSLRGNVLRGNMLDGKMSDGEMVDGEVTRYHQLDSTFL
ncbi:hypothetical protein QTP88_012962 [Uroleucon formosanum]